MGNAGDYLPGALAFEQGGGGRKRSGGFGQIVHQEHVFAADFADDSH